MRRPPQFVGMRVGWLIAVSVVWHKLFNRPSSVIFQCECGNLLKVGIQLIKENRVPERCEECLPKQERPDKLTKYRRLIRDRISEYNTWKNRKRYMCKRWKESFEKFIKDIGARPDGMCLCRYNTRRYHSPTNSYWGPIRSDGSKLKYKQRPVTSGWLKKKFGVRRSFTQEIMRRGEYDADVIIQKWNNR